MNIAPSSYPSPSLPPALFPDSVHPSSNPNLKNIVSSSDQQSGSYSQATFSGPYMGVVLVVLVVTFFLMAAFSVYVRRYAFLLGADAGTGRDIRSVQGRGLDRAAIDGLPMVVYHCTKEGSNGGGGAGAAAAAAAAQEHEWSRRPDCVVCLADFQEAEKLRLLPKCEHCFHPECIDMWLFSHSTCPLCRRSLLPLALPPSSDICISVQAPPPPPPPPSVQAHVPPPPPPSVQAPPPPPPPPPVAAPPMR